MNGIITTAIRLNGYIYVLERLRRCRTRVSYGVTIHQQRLHTQRLLFKPQIISPTAILINGYINQLNGYIRSLARCDLLEYRDSRNACNYWHQQRLYTRDSYLSPPLSAQRLYYMIF